MNDKNIDIITEIGKEINKQYANRPSNPHREEVVCSTFVMIETARLKGIQKKDNETNSPEESWLEANRVVLETELGLNDAPVGIYEDLIGFVQHCSTLINSVIKD